MFGAKRASDDIANQLDEPDPVDMYSDGCSVRLAGAALFVNGHNGRYILNLSQISVIWFEPEQNPVVDKRFDKPLEQTVVMHVANHRNNLESQLAISLDEATFRSAEHLIEQYFAAV